LDQWNFFVLEKKEVGVVLKKSKSISLKKLNKMNKGPLNASELPSEISRFVK
jgi:hypothetical protein